MPCVLGMNFARAPGSTTAFHLCFEMQRQLGPEDLYKTTTLVESVSAILSP